MRKSSVATKLPSLTESKPLEMNRRARQVVFVMFVTSLVVFAVLLALPRGALKALKG